MSIVTDTDNKPCPLCNGVEIFEGHIRDGWKWACATKDCTMNVYAFNGRTPLESRDRCKEQWNRRDGQFQIRLESSVGAQSLETIPRPFCDWHEDHGDVLWWLIPVSEAPYVGSPICLGRKESHEVTEGMSIVIDGVGGWPFSESDHSRLWWTPLPDGKMIEDQVPL